MMEAGEQSEVDEDAYSTVYIEEPEEKQEAPLQLQMSYDEFWEDFLQQACSCGMLEEKETFANRVKNEALENLVVDGLEKKQKYGVVRKVAKKVWNYGKQIARPAVVGAALGYFGNGVEGAQQGAIAGSVCVLPLMGIGIVTHYTKKDQLAPPGMEYKAYAIGHVKDNIEYVEAKMGTPLFAFPLLAAGVLALSGGLLGLGAGLCAKIGAIEGLLEGGGCLINGKKWQTSVKKEIQQHPEKYLPSYVPPTEE